MFICRYCCRYWAWNSAKIQSFISRYYSNLCSIIKIIFIAMLQDTYLSKCLYLFIFISNQNYARIKCYTPVCFRILDIGYISSVSSLFSWSMCHSISLEPTLPFQVVYIIFQVVYIQRTIGCVSYTSLSLSFSMSVRTDKGYT